MVLRSAVVILFGEGEIICINETYYAKVVKHEPSILYTITYFWFKKCKKLNKHFYT